MREDQKELRIALKRYLGQYYRAKMRRAQLEARLRNFRAEMTGGKGMQYSPVPPSSCAGVNSTVEMQVVRAVEIEERMVRQQVKVQEAMLAVIEVMDFLSIDSPERIILEYRHIDCLSWKQICREMCMTKTPCNRYYNTALDMLLKRHEVVNLLNSDTDDVYLYEANR